MALALALKYRPTTFSDLVAQESVAKTLSLALQSNRIAHAYLFSGLRGSGKTSSARIFARALQCQKAPISDPCNQCDSCLQSLEGRHLDIIEMDAASSRKIDDIRNLIEQTRYAPSYGRYKIFIIDEVHMLTKEAFNALLKTLEEPPSYVKFILATTDPLKLPATILSRTQHFRFKKIPHKAIIQHLYSILDKENIVYEKDAIEIIARSGSGSLRDTLTITDQAINYCNQNITRSKVSEMLGAVDTEILQRYFNALISQDESELDSILEIFEEYEAEIILDEMMLYLKDHIKERTNISMLILDRYLQIIAQAKNLLSLNCDGGFVLLLTRLKMQEAQKYNLISEEIQGLERQIKQQPFVSQSQPNVITPIKNTGLTSFEQLVAKIYDRNFELGKTFEDNITFISFENNTLIWESKAIGSSKDLLRENYATIKNFAQEIFGIHTKIIPQQSEFKDSSPLNQTTVQESQAINTPPKIDLQEQSTISSQTAQINSHSTDTQTQTNIPVNTPQTTQQENPVYTSNTTDSAHNQDLISTPSDTKATNTKFQEFYEKNKTLIQSMQQHLDIKEVKRVKQ
ncbi:MULTISPECIES: DNA polymerase III subunit gamma/tau [unclassified Helicobacter]|uniref:DNA polymerase III subunit gamma/tau n=1 Tax=unclassified Helicobacter TaxID=2593540 RepID=UPI000CF13644|nr:MULTISPECIES: DNA polymerase III subunit gamma/tau [unclassified Helicobacter]